MAHQHTSSVLLFRKAIEPLGEATRPFLRSGQFGEYIPGQTVDTRGPLRTLAVDTATLGHAGFVPS